MNLQKGYQCKKATIHHASAHFKNIELELICRYVNDSSDSKRYIISFYVLDRLTIILG